MKALKITGAMVAAIIVVVALLLAVGIPSGFLRAAIQNRVERDTGYHLTIAGAITISLWPSLNVTINDVTLQDPRDHDGSNRVTVGSVQADMTLSSAWSGHPHISQLIVTRPVLHVPLLRERKADVVPASRPPGSTAKADAVAIDRVSVKDGAIVFSNRRDRVERRIDGIEADATVGANRKIDLRGTARAGDHPLKFQVVAQAPAPPIERQIIPFELKLDAPGLLHAPLTARAEVQLNGSVAVINGVNGTLGDSAFSGWASVDVASKPLVKLDLDFRRLDIAAFKSPPTAPAQSWSDAPLDLTGLNYVDAQVRLSAAEINVADAHFAPAAIDATLAAGVLRATVSNLGAYGGQASGEVIVDASSGSPNYAMHCDLVGVRALPLLTSLADFDKLDGKLQAKIAARSTGNSAHAIVSNLGGSVFANFQDGAIRGLNVIRMIRSLTSNPLSGWQEGAEQSTDLTQLSASFKIDRGQATTTDLNLVGPLVKVTGGGTIDLPAKSIALRVEPKLVMTTEGQGRASDPIGFGIPVMIEGPWTEPRIYPAVAGILDNPDAAYAKLRDVGAGLFGQNGASIGGLLGNLPGLGGNSANGPGGDGANGGSAPSDPLGGKLGETLGNLIQQGLGPRNRGIPSSFPTQPRAAEPQPSQRPENDAASAPSQDNQQENQQDGRPMDDVLRWLFRRSAN